MKRSKLPKESPLARLGVRINITNAPVTAYLDQYYEENPLDTSYEGTLAQKSGLTKDEVVALLDTIEYWDAIAKYDPSTRYQMGQEPQIATEFHFENKDKTIENQLGITSLLPILDRRQQAMVTA